jgi:hypothetical protein
MGVAPRMPCAYSSGGGHESEALRSRTVWRITLNATYAGERGRYSGTAGLHPVSVTFPDVEYRNKLYAVPIIGLVLKWVMLIPFFIALYIVSIIVQLAGYVTWIPVMFVGKYAGFADTIYGGYVRWTSRIAAYMTGIQDHYPSFSFADDAGSGDVSITWPFNEQPKRLWAFPILGIVLKVIICIPHFIALAILSLLCCLLVLVTWIPVITSGVYPQWGIDFIGGTIRWHTRLFTYLYGIHDQYPPFSLD